MSISGILIFFGLGSTFSVVLFQISGVDVHSREQAIRLFAENRADITLLLARPQMIQVRKVLPFSFFIPLTGQEAQEPSLMTVLS